MTVPADAVKQQEQVLLQGTGCKGCVGGSELTKSKGLAKEENEE